LCARSSWRHQTLACGCRSWPHPVVSADSRQRANRDDRSAATPRSLNDSWVDAIHGRAAESVTCAITHPLADERACS
jgi:hypothetical protein